MNEPSGPCAPPKNCAPAAAGSSQKFAPDLAIANLLLDRGASVKIVDGAGYTPLHGAALAVAKAPPGPEAQRTGLVIRPKNGDLGRSARLPLMFPPE